LGNETIRFHDGLYTSRCGRDLYVVVILLSLGFDPVWEDIGKAKVFYLLLNKDKIALNLYQKVLFTEVLHKVASIFMSMKSEKISPFLSNFI
jgi:hypothetical protein